jgi:hypothetical protein
MDQNKTHKQQRQSGDQKNQPQAQQAGTQHEEQQDQSNKQFGSQQSGSQQSGSQSGSQRPGQQDWNQRQTQKPDRDPAEGPRYDQPGRENSPQAQTRGDSPQQDKREPKGSSREFGSQGSGGGISNRGLDRELDEQEQLPERGFRKSDR